MAIINNKHYDKIKIILLKTNTGDDTIAKTISETQANCMIENINSRIRGYESDKRLYKICAIVFATLGLIAILVDALP